MCDHPAKYARFKQSGIVRELAELFKKAQNSATLIRNCGGKLPKDGPPRVEYACHDCFKTKGWDYELRTRH